MAPEGCQFESQSVSSRQNLNGLLVERQPRSEVRHCGHDVRTAGLALEEDAAPCRQGPNRRCCDAPMTKLANVRKGPRASYTAVCQVTDPLRRRKYASSPTRSLARMQRMTALVLAPLSSPLAKITQYPRGQEHPLGSLGICGIRGARVPNKPQYDPTGPQLLSVLVPEFVGCSLGSANLAG